MARDTFKEMIKEGVQEALEEVRSEPEIDEETKENQEYVETLLSTIPKTPDYYLKLYKSSPLPPGVSKAQFKTEILNLHEIDDLEIHIRNLIRDHDWGPGEYMVMLFGMDPKTGRRLPGFRRRPIKFYIDYEPKKKEESISVKDQIGTFKDFVSIAKDILPPPSQVNPVELSKTLAETLKTGVEVAVSSRSKDNGLDPIKIIELVERLKKTDERKEPSLVETLTVLKDLGVFHREEKHDVWQEIARMKDLGLLQLGQEKKEEDVLDTVNKLRALIEVVRPLIVPEAEGKASLGVEIIRTIGPHIPEVVKNITDTINNVAEVAKMSRLGYVKTPPLMQVPQNIQEQPQISQQKVRIDTVWDNLARAIESDDRSYFKKLKEVIILYFGPNVVDYLITNRISVETFLEAIAPQIGQIAYSKEAKAYFENFIKWQIETVSSMVVIAKCKTCGEEWEFQSSEEFEMSGKVCECGGVLEPLGIQ